MLCSRQSMWAQHRSGDHHWSILERDGCVLGKNYHGTLALICDDPVVRALQWPNSQLRGKMRSTLSRLSELLCDLSHYFNFAHISGSSNPSTINLYVRPFRSTVTAGCNSRTNCRVGPVTSYMPPVVVLNM